MLLIIISFLIFGCGFSFEGNSVTGKWRAIITEKEYASLVELELIEKKSIIEGSLTITTDTPENSKFSKTFPVAFVDKSKNSLKLISPVDGSINDDTIVAELTIKGEILEGTLHEKRNNSKKIYVKFVKINTNGKS